MRFLRLDSAARIAGLYVVVAGLYILLSDQLLTILVRDAESLAKVGSLKGLAFVAITAILLYVERKRADRESRYLASIVESADAAIIGATADGIITSWNRGAEELYGYSAREIRGRPASTLYPQERRDDFSFILDKVRSGLPIRSYETTRLRKDGTTVPISLVVSPIRDATGRVTGLSSVAHDISERKRAEKAMQMAEVGQLASGLVHEIRNPLNAMRMQIAVVQDSLESAAPEDIDLAKSQLERLEDEVLRVQKLANDFLAYGRAARDKPERIELPKLLGSIVDFVKPEFEKIGARVDVEIDRDVGGLAVFMDRDKLRQILMNIAQNGRQAITDGGSLTISCDRPAPGRVRIRLRDTGCGIPPEKLPHVFDAFFSTKDEGTGLGLAIVKKTVEAAGGSIRAESEVGQGTCIEIELPTAAQTQDAESARTVASANEVAM